MSTQFDRTRSALALSIVKGLGRKTLISILQGLKDSPQELRNPDAIAPHIKRNQESILQQINDSFDKILGDAEQIIESCSNLSIEILTFGDERYPRLLSLIPDPPALIYCRGDISLLNNTRAVAIIGTREPTDMGKDIAFRTAEEFVQNDFVIVSGLALGIDTCAHEGALSKTGKTIAVLVDVNNITPKKNAEIAVSIVENGGLLIAENKPGTFISSGHFVERDRIQSGLSLGVIPIEAGISSGTMHAVRASKEQNRLLICPNIPKLLELKRYSGNEVQIEGIRHLISNEKTLIYSIKDLKPTVDLLKKKEHELLSAQIVTPDDEPLTSKEQKKSPSMMQMELF
jgi:DNA processing protein